MNKPLLQIALDQTNLQNALTVAQRVASYVDIMEAGTILAFAQGISAISQLRQQHPQHILVCDMKITDGGAILSRMAFDAGADWLTVSAAAHMATIAVCKDIADEFGKEIQIELYGHWTMDDVKAWCNLGIKQAIYHRSRDAELAGISWTQHDIDRMHQLSQLGLELSITGGIVPDDLHLFAGIKTRAFIAGRALADEHGKTTAKALRHEINRYW